MRALQGFEVFDKEMQIQYGKGTSNIIPKLRGTFEPLASATGAGDSSELQKSIFAAPPSSVPGKPTSNGLADGPHGTKRPIDEVEDEDDVAMDEDDDDASMEEDDDDD